MSSAIPQEAFALRPVRMLEKENTIREYSATTFPKDPRAGCEIWLRRCRALGFLKRDEGETCIDILNEQGDILDTVPINRRGFNYLRGKLKFVVEGE